MPSSRYRLYFIVGKRLIFLQRITIPSIIFLDIFILEVLIDVFIAIVSLFNLIPYCLFLNLALATAHELDAVSKEQCRTNMALVLVVRVSSKHLHNILCRLKHFRYLVVLGSGSIEKEEQVNLVT